MGVAILKLKTVLQRMNRHTFVFLLSHETNGYLYAGGLPLCGATSKNQEFCKQLLERKIAAIQAVGENKIQIKLYGGYPGNE